MSSPRYPMGDRRHWLRTPPSSLRWAGVLAACLLAVGGVTAGPASGDPTASAAATCSDYPNQAAAQRAADARDTDGDGIYCESLPCPCSDGAGGGDGSDKPAEKPKPKPSCTKTSGIVTLTFSASKYPNIRRHAQDAIADGWPRTLVLNRPGADARRDRLLEDEPTKQGYDRDEYPPAVGRGKGKGLTQGVNPRGWKADVRLVRSSENRSHGSSMGAKLRRFCNGVRFRYAFE